MTTKAIITTLTVAALSLAATSVAEAQRRRAPRIEGVRIDVHLDLSYYGGFGAGMRVDIPVVPEGVLSGSIQDEMAISVGGDLIFAHYYGRYHDDGVALFPHAAWQWNFYLNDKWSIFPELGLGLWIGNDAHHYHRHDYYQNHNHIWIDPVVGFGARYHFGSRVALLMRAVWPVGLQIGLTF